MKTLLVLAPETTRLQRDEQLRQETADESPRISLLENVLNADVIADPSTQGFKPPSGLQRFFSKFMPAPLMQAFLVFFNRHRYDVVVSWDDRFALAYAFLLKLTRSKARHVAILSWMAPPRKASTLRFVQKGISRIILWSETQRDLLIEFFNIPEEKIAVVPYFVDQKFWRPLEGTGEGVCSVGDSRRDYATLIEAVRDLPIPCQIATRVRAEDSGQGDWGATGSGLARVATVPQNVTIKPASYAELRALYANARFVVLPLFPTFRDNGVTVIAQAMAMGKAVICSRIQGQLEFLEDGVSGIFVPPGNPQALREAIQYLWEHPEVAESMGREGRRRAEEIFALDSFAANVQQVAEAVFTGKKTDIPTMAEKVRAFGNTFARRPLEYSHKE